MRTVVAQGTFDILHPGHLHYLSEAKAMGDELHVILARETNVTHKPGPVIPGPQRVEMVAALEPVDDARLGHPDDIFVPIEAIQPDVIAIGHDQDHDPAGIEAAAAERGVDLEVRRVSGLEPEEDQVLSSGRIIERILARRG
jgi:FAD synthetase